MNLVDRFNRWVRERRAEREAAEDAAASWWDHIKTPEDFDLGPTDPVTKLPGQRLGRHRHARPGDIPDQPTGAPPQQQVRKPTAAELADYHIRVAGALAAESGGIRPVSDQTLGTCDWGDCDERTVVERWEPDLGAWLPVCAEHGGNRPDQPAGGAG